MILVGKREARWDIFFGVQKISLNYLLKQLSHYFAAAVSFLRHLPISTKENHSHAKRNIVNNILSKCLTLKLKYKRKFLKGATGYVCCLSHWYIGAFSFTNLYSNVAYEILKRLMPTHMLAVLPIPTGSTIKHRFHFYYSKLFIDCLAPIFIKMHKSLAVRAFLKLYGCVIIKLRGLFLSLAGSLIRYLHALVIGRLLAIRFLCSCTHYFYFVLLD